MSSDSPKKFQFMVYAPDMTDEGAFQRRLSVREKHLADAKAKHVTGFVKLGGALLTPESIVTPDASKKMVGSMMIFEAANIKEVENVIKGDIYYTSGVWDPEKIVILPFAAAPL
ncbi:hypothetical protein SCHPADRAFT_915678 [Schizopora paradoxa]|uniref:YCII-related domain-containing protein n=1 Tax=Schizopora paradoxa TaxID=27342 RepID=A0A0H2RK03_9AGAM|nr:hypothetical protein SCHPADRAFT_915678 [Schizopora paradoxa]